MAPAVKRLLPPASASGARSSMSTETPISAAASAAENAAFPAPTTTTSTDDGNMYLNPDFSGYRYRRGEPGRPRCPRIIYVGSNDRDHPFACRDQRHAGR